MFNMKACSCSNPMSVSRASYSLPGLLSTSRCHRGRLLQQHWNDLIVRISITCSYRRRGRKRQHYWENSPAADPLRLHIHFTLFSLSRCWAETAITWRLIVRIRTCAMRNFLTKQWAFARASILIFPVRGRSRLYSRISVCIRVIKKNTFYPWRWTFGRLSARENTENKLRVYVLLWESARGCARPQMCERVQSNKNGLTGENTFAFATGVYYNVVFMS